MVMKKKSENVAAKQKGVRFRRSRAVMDRVSAAANGVDQFLAIRLVYFRAESRNVGFDDARLGVEMETPDALEKHRAGHDATAIAHQNFQEAKFARLEVDDVTGPRH